MNIIPPASRIISIQGCIFMVFNLDYRSSNYRISPTGDQARSNFEVSRSVSLNFALHTEKNIPVPGTTNVVLVMGQL